MMTFTSGQRQRTKRVDRAMPSSPAIRALASHSSGFRKKGESCFIQASDGTELHYLRWTNLSLAPWAVVIFLHGIASHAGWFGETAAHLQERGVAVYAPDRRGSGLSGGRRGHLARYDRAIDDLDAMVSLVVAEQPDTPIFLAASSWAAKLGLVQAGRRPPLAGLMLLGPGLLPRVNLSPARRVQVIAGHLVAPTARIAIPLTPEQYTTDPYYLDLIRKDPLRILSATTQFFWETARLDRLRLCASAQLKIPLLVLQGEADAMMDVPRTRRWFSSLDTEDKTYRSYSDAGHTVDFGPTRAGYLADMLAWLTTRVASPAPGGRRIVLFSSARSNLKDVACLR